MSDENTQASEAETEAPNIGDFLSEPTPKQSIDRAFDSVDSKYAEVPEDPIPQNGKASDTPVIDAVEEVKEEVQEETVEEEAKEETPGFGSAPDRFSSDAKEQWDEAPLSVRAEVARMEKELTAGLEKHRERAEAYGEFEEFHNVLKQNGQNFRDVVAQYTGIENLLRQNPMQGLDQICRNMGTDLMTVAKRVAGVEAEGGQENAELNYLRQQNAQLQSQLGSLSQDVQGVRNTVTQQTEAQVMQQINEFASANPRFTELEDHIGRLLETGMASNLPDAYAMAEKLNPAPAPAAQATPTPAPKAQTQTGQLSPTGNPPGGSNPHERRKSENARDAINHAFDRVFG